MARVSLVIAFLAAGSFPATAQDDTKPDPVRVDAAVKAAFPTVAADWQARLVPDETLKLCSTYRGSPPQAIFEKIEKSERAKIQYPADGKFLGDWNAGEKIAQSGYGLRFTDYPPTQPNGGNCYACHQLAAQELSYGTIGPSLYRYAAARAAMPRAELERYTYGKIYDAEAYVACTNMPRFGAKGILSEEQIRNVAALLLDPSSPVNR